MLVLSVILLALVWQSVCLIVCEQHPGIELLMTVSDESTLTHTFLDISSVLENPRFREYWEDAENEVTRSHSWEEYCGQKRKPLLNPFLSCSLGAG